MPLTTGTVDVIIRPNARDKRDNEHHYAIKFYQAVLTKTDVKKKEETNLLLDPLTLSLNKQTWPGSILSSFMFPAMLLYGTVPFRENQ